MGYNKSMDNSDQKPTEHDGILERHQMDQSPQKLTWRTWLIGRPLTTASAPHQTIGKMVGLAVFGADALSSIAYAPQEMLVILAAAGTQAFGYAFPISIIITVLLAIVTISYQQTIHAYPSGGGGVHGGEGKPGNHIRAGGWLSVASGLHPAGGGGNFVWRGANRFCHSRFV
jgi:hypothetical protein